MLLAGLFLKNRMYKATHSYTGTQDHILSFSPGDIHYILEKNNASWWLASNSFGKVGYVPKDYFQPYQVCRILFMVFLCNDKYTGVNNVSLPAWNLISK